MDKFKEATDELVSAITENKTVHDEALKQNDEESRRRYKDSYARVEAAEKAWKTLFKPGALAE